MVVGSLKSRVSRAGRGFARFARGDQFIAIEHGQAAPRGGLPVPPIKLPTTQNVRGADFY